MVVSMMSVMGVASASAYDTIGELDAAIRAGGTITLDNDFTYSGSLYVPAGKTVTLDLAGHKIESTNDCAIKSVGTLTIKDTVGGGEVVAQECCVLATSNAKTTINSGTFTAKDNAVFMGNGTPGEGGCTWYIKGGTFNASIQSPGYTACGIYAPNDDTWNISGGTFNVTNGVGICQRAGTVKVTGGTFNVTGDGTLGKVGDSKVVVPSGTAVVYDSKANYPEQKDTAKTTVTAGTFNTAQSPVTQVKADGDATRVTVSGGTFGTEPATEFVDPVYQYDDATDKIVAKEGLTAEWEWVGSTSASYRYQAQLTLKDGDTTVYTKAYNPTIAANADGSFTYSCKAQKVAGISYGPIADKNIAAGFEILTGPELNAAAKVAGEWTLGADISYAFVTVSNGFKLDGKNHKITSAKNLPSYAMFSVKDKNTQFELSNVTLDGDNYRWRAISLYDSSSGGNNPNAKATLTNVAIHNFKSGDYTGAVYAFGTSTVVLNNCDITGNTVKATKVDDIANTGSSVWAGAKATVNINGGTFDEILLHGGTAKTTIEGGATVDTVRFGFTNRTEDSTNMQAVINDATVNSVEKYTDFTPENVVMDPAQATIGAPAGYEWEDSETTGMKTLVSTNPLSPVVADSPSDGNAFELNCKYLNGTLLGVQLKTKAGEDTSDQENGDHRDLRYVAVIAKSLIDDPEVTDYGFVLAKVGTGKTTSNTNFNNLRANWGNGEKTISAKGTYNNVCGDEKYGNPDDPSTDYKYVTCAVNGVDTNSKIAARFYVVKNGKTYYAKYAQYNYNFTGCTAGITAAGAVN
jgi:hypothetical protein